MAEFKSIYEEGEELEEIRAKLRDLEAQIAANNPRNIAGIREKELRALTRANFFGDGSDGDVVLDGTTDFNDFSSRSSTTYTLTRDVYFQNLTIKSGVTVKPNGYKIFVSEDLSNRGDILSNGGDGGDGADASGSTGGTGGTAGTAAQTAGSLTSTHAGKVGATGQNAGGVTAVNGTAGDDSDPSLGVVGVAGGDASYGEPNNSSGGGGAAGSFTEGNNLPRIYTYALLLLDTYPSIQTLLGSSGSGSGGGGGGGDTGDGAGGGGGGSGAAGGIIVIFAQRIINEGTISANGGDGGAGGAGSDVGSDAGGNGGGGAGGSGGSIVLVYGIKSGAGSETVDGGTGGAAGTGGFGTASAGGTGNGGVIYEIELG